LFEIIKEQKTPEVIATDVKVEVPANLESIIKPEIQLDEKDLNEIFRSLYDYQKRGAWFLAENKQVIFSDQLGLGKTIEVIAGLKILFKKEEITSVLVVTKPPEMGDTHLSRKTGSPVGWAGHFAEFAPELSCHTVPELYDQKNVNWNISSQVFITNYDSLFNDIEEGKTDKEFLQKFDAVVFDEAQNLINNYFGLANIFKSTKYLWAVTSLPAESVDMDLKLIFNDEQSKVKFHSSLRRQKEEIKNELPSVIRQNFWLDLEDDQKKEFDEALKKGQQQISEFLEKGNPYRFQANIFFLIHQLNQICNFSSNKETSKKSDLLLDHLDIISRSGDQVLIFSQYDKFGTQRIEQLLQKNNMKYVRYIGGMSATAMETAIKSFKSNKKVPVFLASLKAAGVKYNLAEVPYLIHFDQWWNPISHWQAEERVNNPENESPPDYKLNIFNYITKSPVDEKIRQTLNEKSLLEKNLIESLSAEAVYSLITMDEWLDILGIKKDTLFNKDEIYDLAFGKLQQLNYEELGDRVKNLLIRMGYKNLILQKDDLAGEVNIYGTSQKNGNEIKIAAKCLSSGFVTKEKVNEFKDLSLKNSNKVFIFTRGNFDEDIKAVEGMTLVNGKTLANYFTTFQC
jgi:SNF2 family DNA or RNA helicase